MIRYTRLIGEPTVSLWMPTEGADREIIVRITAVGPFVDAPVVDLPSFIAEPGFLEFLTQVKEARTGFAIAAVAHRCGFQEVPEAVAA